MANLFYFGRMGLILYKSSAGSGKTFTLVNRFLTKVLDKPWLFSRILAITFTNKAAREMRERVEKLIGTASQGIWLGTFHSVCARWLRRDLDGSGGDPRTGDFTPNPFAKTSLNCCWKMPAKMLL